MRPKNDAKAKQLRTLIENKCAANPKRRHGYTWAIFSHAGLAESLDVSAKTVARWIKDDPLIQSLRCQATDDATGKTAQAVALRVGDPPKRTPERVAGNMSKMFRRTWAKRHAEELAAARLTPQHLEPRGIDGLKQEIDALKPAAGEQTPDLAKLQARLDRCLALQKWKPRLLKGDEYGCLVGLAGAWPEGHQEVIFKDMLANWPAYAAAIKSDPEYDPRVKGKKVDRYLRFPSIPLLRRFAHQVPDFYLTRLQLAGKPLPFPYAKEAA